MKCAVAPIDIMTAEVSLVDMARITLEIAVNPRMYGRNRPISVDMLVIVSMLDPYCT